MVQPPLSSFSIKNCLCLQLSNFISQLPESSMSEVQRSLFMFYCLSLSVQAGSVSASTLLLNFVDLLWIVLGFTPSDKSYTHKTQGKAFSMFGLLPLILLKALLLNRDNLEFMSFKILKDIYLRYHLESEVFAKSFRITPLTSPLFSIFLTLSFNWPCLKAFS